MSTTPKDHVATLHDAIDSAAQSRPGEVCWSIRKPDGATLTCELRDQGQWGVELQMSRDGEFLSNRRWPDRSAAVVEADDLKTAQIRAGGVVLEDARDAT
jgi:hypothetical protein